MTKLNTPGQQLSDDDIAAQDLQQVEDQMARQAAEAEAQKKREEAALTPAERWKRNITAVGLTEEQARLILREILKTGYWTKSYSLFQGVLQVTFRTRTAYSRQREALALDALNKPYPQDVGTQVQYRLRLAGSLVEYDDTNLPHPDRKETREAQQAAFEERLRFIDNHISESMLDTIYTQLSAFDRILWAVMSEGAVQGF